MAGFVNKNNAKGLLQAAITAGATTSTLQAGHTFPALGAGEYTFGTFISTSNALEVVKITGISGNNFTHSPITGNYAAGDRLELRPCKEMLDALLQEQAVRASVTLANGPNNYTGTPVPAITSLAAAAWIFKFPNANTSTTVNINLAGIGNVRVKDREGNDPAIGAIKANSQHFGLYDGTNFALISLEPNLIVNPPAVQVRQAPQVGAVDTNGLANWLSAGTGLTINYAATAAAVVLAFAAGFTSFGSNDLVTQLSADATNQFGTLPASNTAFIFADYVDATHITGSNTLVPPQYGSTFDRVANTALNFNNNVLDNFGKSWTTVGSPSFDTTNKVFGAASLALNGSTQYVTNSDIRTFGNGSWFRSVRVRFAALPGSGTQQNVWCAVNNAGWGVFLSLINTAGVTKLRLGMSSNGSSADIGDVLGTTTTWATGTWYNLVVGYDALAGKYFVQKDGAAAEISVSSALRICAVTGEYVGAYWTGSASNFVNGNVDEFLGGLYYPYGNGAVYTVAAAEAVVGGVANSGLPYLVNWFDIPNMVMREVSAASGVANTNPTFTARNRLFVGEADTGSSTVSAVRNYAYRRSYVGAWTTGLPASSVPLSVNHNIGNTELDAKLVLECVATDANYSPGTRLVAGVGSTGGQPVAIWSDSVRMGTTVQSGGRWSAEDKSNGAYTQLTAASWKYRFEAKGNF